MIKSLKKLGMERVYFNTIQVNYDKHIVNSILNGKKLKLFLLKSETR
jgi:hypothetical protein